MAWRGLVPVTQLPAHIRRNVGVNWVGPGGHVVNYLLRRAEIFNFVGIVERDWRVESWTEKGSREECAAANLPPGSHPREEGGNLMIQLLTGQCTPKIRFIDVAMECSSSWPQCRGNSPAVAGLTRRVGVRAAGA